MIFFTGHMSGPNWAPPWMLLCDEPMPDGVNQVISGGRVVDCAVRNPSEDPLVLEAERLLLSTVVHRYKGHPAIGIWNLGNEPDSFAWPTSHRSGMAWAEQMTSLIKSIDPFHPVTCGLHAESLQQANGLWAGEIFGAVDIAVMHGYPMYSDWSTGNLDPWYVPFLCSLTSAFCGKPTTPRTSGHRRRVTKRSTSDSSAWSGPMVR